MDNTFKLGFKKFGTPETTTYNPEGLAGGANAKTAGDKMKRGMILKLESDIKFFKIRIKELETLLAQLEKSDGKFNDFKAGRIQIELNQLRSALDKAEAELAQLKGG